MFRTATSGFLLVLLASGCTNRAVSSVVDSGSGNENQNQNSNGSEVCAGPEDCEIAWQVDQCCPCPEPVTRWQLESEPCLISIYQSHIPPECFVQCPDVECPPCAHFNEPVTCAAGICVWNDGRCSDDSDCLLVIRVDDCCTQAFTMSRDDIGADPCLVYWPPPMEISSTCRAQWAQDCDLINCTWSPPPTRNARCTLDGCELVPECGGAGDCALARNARRCCPCPEAWPASMIGRDPCLVPESSPLPADCPAAQCLVDCNPCPDDAWASCEQQICATHHP